MRFHAWLRPIQSFDADNLLFRENLGLGESPASRCSSYVYHFGFRTEKKINSDASRVSQLATMEKSHTVQLSICEARLACLEDRTSRYASEKRSLFTIKVYPETPCRKFRRDRVLARPVTRRQRSPTASRRMVQGPVVPPEFGLCELPKLEGQDARILACHTLMQFRGAPIRN